MGGRPGRAGEGVGEQGARQHHHAGALGQGRLNKFVRNKALDTMFKILCLLGLGTLGVNCSKTKRGINHLKEICNQAFLFKIYFDK